MTGPKGTEERQDLTVQSLLDCWRGWRCCARRPDRVIVDDVFLDHPSQLADLRLHDLELPLSVQVSRHRSVLTMDQFGHLSLVRRQNGDDWNTKDHQYRD